MFRNYLAAALRNLVRNRLYAAISIGGLAIGMAAAILTGLYIRDELTFDHFIPGHENIYVVVSHTTLPGQAEQVADATLPWVAQWLKLDVPEVQEVARILPSMTLMSVRHGQVEAPEKAAFVDPGFFTMVRLPVLAGDLAAAGRQPESVVVTRQIARKYFGVDAPIGQLIELERGKPFRIAAVIRDLPANSHLDFGLFAYSRDPSRGLARWDAQTYVRGRLGYGGRVYVRVAGPKAAEAVRRALPGLVSRHIDGASGPNAAYWKSGVSYALSLVRLDALHFSPQTVARMAGSSRRGDVASLYALGAASGLILAMAAVNFINLLTARAAHRAVEVGVRKAAGASRRALVVQFLGEALMQAVLATLLAIALVEIVLPGFNAVFLRTVRFDYWRDPVLLLSMAGLTAGVGLLAGLYPALVLSAFRPAVVLKLGSAATGGSRFVREALVVAQFAVLIGLLLSTVVIVRQTRFVLTEGLRVDTGQVVTVNMSCKDAFVQKVRALQGVKAAGCSDSLEITMAPEGGTEVHRPGGPKVTLGGGAVGFGFFELYRIRPLAGRLFSPAFGHDVAASFLSSEGPPAPPATVVINASAARALGFRDAAAAVGATFSLIDLPGQSQIVGVVPDFTIDLLHGPVRPTLYYIDPGRLRSLNVKLDGRDVPATLTRLDDLWSRFGEPRAMERRFADQYLRGFYGAAIREGWLVGALAVVGVFIAALGLFGLAAFTAERRTKEIGMRKAMGASTTEILGLLLRQFAKPVLTANLIAWPLSWWTMHGWLQGFSARIALDPWLFVAASAVALTIAMLTVLGQALKVAREKPMKALRYE